MLGLLLLAVGGYLIYKEMTKKRDREVVEVPVTRPQFIQQVNPDGMAVGIRTPQVAGEEIVVR